MEESPLLSNACRLGTNRMPQFGAFGSFRKISAARLMSAVMAEFHKDGW